MEVAEVAEVAVAEGWRRWRWRWRWPGHDQLLHAGEPGRDVDAPAGGDQRVADSHARRERARWFSDGTGSQAFVATSYLETSASPSKDGRFVPPIAYSCPWTTARPAVFLAIGMSANWSRAVHAFVAGSKPQVLLSTSSGFVRPPDK